MPHPIRPGPILKEPIAQGKVIITDEDRQRAEKGLEEGRKRLRELEVRFPR